MGAWCWTGAWDLSSSTHPSFSPCSVASVTGEAMSEGKGASEVGQTLHWAKVWTLGWWAQGA